MSTAQPVQLQLNQREDLRPLCTLGAKQRRTNQDILNEAVAGAFEDKEALKIMGGFSGNYPALGALLKALQKRKAYFSFHFDDIMRVNNVRQAWKIDHPDAPTMRSFYDSSLWESRKLENPESIKRLIREGVEHTSAICVLVGSETWSRRWVRYEIARAVIDGRGLLAVHLNNLRHHLTKLPSVLGQNPLAYMAVGKVQPSLLAPPRYYLFEYMAQGWIRYQDHSDPVSLPRYLADPDPGYVVALSTGTAIYDYVFGNGHKDIGAWIDQAAQRVGR